METINICEFILPVNLGTEEAPDWSFSEMICEEGTPERYEIIQNLEYPEREFVLDKSISYGDLFFMFVVVLALIGIITKSVLNYFWQK